MFRNCIPVLMMAAALAQAEHDSLGSQPVGGVSIPAELTTTVRAENAHRGDSVEFRTLEPVLIMKGVVMPANVKLTGRVVGAAPRRGDKPSWLVLLVERAQWKNQSVPLHAYISAQVSMSSVNTQNGQLEIGKPATTNSRRLARESAITAAHNGIDISSSTRLPQDSSSASPPEFSARSIPLKDLRIVHDKEGIAYLFSSQSNVKLPSGTLFMLQNEPAIVTNQAGADVSGQASPDPPR